MIGNSAKVFADIELREVIYSSTVENRISDYIVEILLSGKVDSGNCIRRGNPRVYSKNKIKKRQGKAEGNLDKGVRH